MTKIETHEKCIRILEAIEKLQNRRIDHLLNLTKFDNSFVYYDVKRWNEKRIEITVAMIDRLKAYYLKTLNKLT
jgi:hypothetical protein